MNEIILFKNKIKPALLLSEHVLKKNNIIINDYYHIPFRGSILISHNPIPEIKDDFSTVGKILGYYPKSCELFEAGISNINEFIDFGGIHFNTGGLYEEALQWCKDTYSEEMLKKYKKIRWFRSVTVTDRIDFCILSTDKDSVETITA
jgi:hypothetical protein